MARRKKFKVSVSVVRSIIVLVFLLFVGTLVTNAVKGFLISHKLFTVKYVMIEPSVLFIDSPQLQGIKGRNIFDVDILKIQKSLHSRYPQLSSLRVSRELPDVIRIDAEQRTPVAQVYFNGKYFVIDHHSVVLQGSKDVSIGLPMIEGFSFGRVVPGSPIDGREMRLALSIVESFGSEEQLSRHTISSINVLNLSKVIVLLDGSMNIILDKESIQQKVHMLALLLGQNKFEPDQVRYIDLRFNEPIVGKR